MTDDKAKILIVDDRSENLVALEAILATLGHLLVRAKSGEEALKALLTDEFALILLDVSMPGMDGFETATHIKQRVRTRDVPIIFLTAVHDDPGQAFRGYSSGAADYITKPFDPWVLRAKVAVFVDLYLKTKAVREQAALLGQKLDEDADGRPPIGPELARELSGRLAGVEDRFQVLRAVIPVQASAAADEVSHRLAELREVIDALVGR